MIKTRSESETEALGKSLGAALPGGAFVALFGEMGAGKTAFARGFGRALGIFEISSPTFTVVMEHENDAGEVLLHFDAYRLSGPDEIHAIGFDDYLARCATIIMEWPQNVEGALPENRLDVMITVSGDERVFNFVPRGREYERVLQKDFYANTST